MRIVQHTAYSSMATIAVLYLEWWCVKREADQVKAIPVGLLELCMNFQKHTGSCTPVPSRVLWTHCDRICCTRNVADNKT